MLLECAIGDALGAAFEAVPEDFIKKHIDGLDRYYSHPKHQLFSPGKYTDDTQMSIAMAQACLDGTEDPVEIVKVFLNQFWSDIRPGYASNFYDFLKSVGSPRDFLQRIKPNSTKSGAAMRAAPIGLLPSLAQVMRFSEIQAKLTHDTPEGITSSHLVACAVYFFYHMQGKKKSLHKFLKSQSFPLNLEEVQQRRIGGGMGCVRAALDAILAQNNFTGIARQIIAKGGDTDTALAIAFSIASVCKEIQNDLPSNLYQELENGEFGRDFLVQKDFELLKAFPPKAPQGKVAHLPRALSSMSW